MYRVTGGEGQELWLFGTIHVGDSRTARLPQAIYDAFDASDALLVEYDPDAFEAQLEDEEILRQLQESYYYPDGSGTYDHIDDPLIYEGGIRLLTALGQYTSELEYLRPAIWSQIIDDHAGLWCLELSSDYGADFQLLERAREQEKKVLGVETGLDQMRILTDMDDSVQEMLLSSSISCDHATYNDQSRELYEMWCRGDEEELRDTILTENQLALAFATPHEKASYAAYENAMYTVRNAGMLELAKEYLESGETVFYAVGLAHLLSEDGLVNTLRDAGYTVELVPTGD